MKKLLSLCLSSLLIFGSASGITNFSTALSASINIGDYVQMGTYYEQPILWRCIDIDEHGPLMLSDKIICFKAFDADTSVNTSSGSHSINPQLRKYGSNYWGDSNIRSWLNSSESAGNVKWHCGNPPSADYVDYGDPYDQEAGFLTNFTTQEINIIKEVSQKSLLPMIEIDSGITAAVGTEPHTYEKGLPNEALQNYDTAYSEYVSDKIFLLDLKQLNDAYGNRGLLGDDYLVGKPTAECGADYADFSSYWLRTPIVDKYDGQYVRTVDEEAYVYSSCADNSFNGIRPAFYLDISKASLSDGNGTNERPYIMSGTADPAVTAPPQPDDPSGVFVKIGYASGSQGDTVEIPLTLSNNTGFSNIALELEYDSSVLTLESVKENTNVGATFTAAQKITANPYNMSWNSATSNNTFNGTLVTLSFKISDSAQNGNYPIALSFYKGRNGDYIDGSSVNYDIDHTALGLSYVSGNVTVSQNSKNDISPVSAKYYDDLNRIDVDAYLPKDRPNYEGTVIVSLYDDSDKLIAVQIKNAEYHNHFEFYDMTSNYTAKIMWWNSVGSLFPLSNVKEIIPSQ